MSVEQLVTTIPLASIARPARGRALVDRFVYGMCVEAEAYAHGAHLARELTRQAGPTRATPVRLQTARGAAAVADALDELEARGQSHETVTRLARRYGAVSASAEAAGLSVVFLVATCGALWPQTARLVAAQ